MAGAVFLSIVCGRALVRQYIPTSRYTSLVCRQETFKTLWNKLTIDHVRDSAIEHPAKSSMRTEKLHFMPRQAWRAMNSEYSNKSFDASLEYLTLAISSADLQWL